MKKVMKLVLWTAILIVSIQYSSSQVLNDDCANATDLGFLDWFAGGCISGAIMDTCFYGSNINAIANFPYFSMSNCTGYANSTASPANDAWYKFKTPGFQIILSNGFFSPIDTLHLNIWAGDSCSSLKQIACYTMDFINDNVMIDTIIWFEEYLTISEYYYLQFSGNSIGKTGDFLVELRGCFGCSFSSVYYVGVGPDTLCFDYKINHTNTSYTGANDGTASVIINAGNGSYTYNWSDGNSDSIRTNLSEGVYYITISDINGCTETDTIEILTDSVISSVNEFHNDVFLQVYPNPNNNEVIIKMDVAKNKNVEIRLVNLSGQVIYEEKQSQLTGSYQKKIDLQGYAKGIYYLQIITDTEVINKKLILE